MNNTQMNEFLNAKAQEIFANNKVWHYDEDGSLIEHNDGKRKMLIVSEIAEAMEGHRKNLMDDHLPQFKMLDVEMADTFIRTLDQATRDKITIDVNLNDHIFNVTDTDDECEGLLLLVDCVISWYWEGSHYEESAVVDYLISSIFKYCEKFNINLLPIVEAKLAYNLNRADHKRENMNAEGGKKF